MNNNFLNPYRLFDSSNMVYTLTSVPVNVQYMDNVGIQLAWTSTAAGLITVESSLDYNPLPTVPATGTWNALTFNPALAQPAGTPGGYLINLNQLPYPWVRLKWVPTVTGAQATLVVQDLTYTAVLPGPGGNDITIAYIDPGANNQPLGVVVTDTDIVVNLATNGGGSITSTAAQILAAIEASDDASALVTVVVSGTGSNVQTAAAETPLADGAGEVGFLTADICAKNL